MRFGNSDGCRDTVVSTIYGFDYRMVGGLCGKAVVRKIEILKGAYKKKLQLKVVQREKQVRYCEVGKKKRRRTQLS